MWTDELPTTPGFYWMWLPGQPVRLVELVWRTDWAALIEGRCDQKALHIQGFSAISLLPLTSFRGVARWIGPLSVPMAPEEWKP